MTDDDYPRTTFNQCLSFTGPLDRDTQPKQVWEEAKWNVNAVGVYAHLKFTREQYFGEGAEKLDDAGRESRAFLLQQRGDALGIDQHKLDARHVKPFWQSA